MKMKLLFALNFSYCKIGFEGGEAIGEGLKTNKSLTELDLETTV